MTIFGHQCCDLTQKSSIGGRFLCAQFRKTMKGDLCHRLVIDMPESNG